MKSIIVAKQEEQFKQIDEKIDVNIKRCYQCGKCTAGCPVAFAMDVSPNQIIRMLQLGLLNDALTKETIWLCASCSTCSTRCPKDVDLARIMDKLRHLAVEQGIKAEGRGKKVSLFNQLFLEDVKKYGRAHEMGLIMRYNLSTLNPFKDALVGMTLLSKGKLKINPHRIKGAKEMARIMENVKRLEAEK